MLNMVRQRNTAVAESSVLRDRKYKERLDLIWVPLLALHFLPECHTLLLQDWHSGMVYLVLVCWFLFVASSRVFALKYSLKILPSY